MDKNEPSLINNLIQNDQNYQNYTNSNKEIPLENIKLNWLRASSCFKGRAETLTEINKLFETENTVVIHGIPGIGKTETARQFAIKNSEYFNGNLIWVYAETKEKIQNSFRLLKKSFRICRLGVTSEDVSQLYCVFKNSPCLFIFDNAENMEAIEDFLPNNQLHPTVKVLITSQFSDWDLSIGQVPLKALELKDAVDILSEKLQDKFNKKPKEIWYKLVEKLEGIPLSIQIISSLLNQEFRTVPIEKFDFDSFIDGLMDRNFINSKFPNLYNKTVLASIYSALNRLKMEEPHSFDLLSFAAYLDADHIYPKDLLLVPSINKSKDILEEALSKLKDYSLIQFGKEDYFIKVHRTIQLVSRNYDLNELNGNMFKATLKIILDDLLFDQMPSVFKYVKTEEFQKKSIEFYSDIDKNGRLRDLYFSYLAEYHCANILCILLPKFKNDFYKTDEYNKILNEMLFDAISKKNTDMRTIDLLIKYGAKIKYSFSSEIDMTNGFHEAHFWLSKELFDRLLESNDFENVINSQDRWGRTILHLLVLRSDKNNIVKTIECMDYLISKRNADISIQDNHLDNILHTACENVNICLRMIKYLVEICNFKNLIICQNEDGETPLQVLFRENSSNSEFNEIVSYLINECDITIINNYGRNILFVVCRYGTSKFVEIVFRSQKCRGIINIQDIQGDVAFSHLIQNYRIEEDEKIELMKLFIENEMNFKIRNKENKTLAKMAKKQKLLKLSDKLKEREISYHSCTCC